MLALVKERYGILWRSDVCLQQEMMPPVLASGSEVTEFDPDWLLVKVNDGVPLKKRSMFRFSHFPR